MIFDKKALLALGIACAAAGPFSRVDAVRGYEKKSPLDTTARKLDAKAVKEGKTNGVKKVVPGSSEPKGSGQSTSKGGKNPPNSSKAHKEESTSLFVTSAACAQKCISAEFEPENHLLTNAIQQCDARSRIQQWDIVQVPHSTFVKVKSVFASGDSTNGGWCLGVVPQEVDGLGMFYGTGMVFMGGPQGDPGLTGSQSIIDVSQVLNQMFTAGAMPMGGGVVGDGYEDDDMCRNDSKLGLVRCDHQTSNWYPTDGQLISTFCWGIGHSSILSVNEECTDLHLSTTTDGATAISRQQTFMVVTQDFIETIPAPAAAPTYSPTYMPTYGPTDGPTD